MRHLRWAVLSLVLGLVAFVVYPSAQPPAVQFYGVGDLPTGGVNSMVQEATQVGTTVYAVGASTQTATNALIPNLDTAVIWDSATNVLTTIPDLVAFPDPQPISANSVIYAITRDAQHIGGRLRNTATNSGLSNGFSSLRTLGSLKLIPGFTALDISENANIVYGQQSGGTGAPAGVNNSRAIRSDVSGASAVTVQVPRLTPAAITPGGPCSTSAPTCLDNLPAYRGMSRDGSVLVGTAFTGAFTGSQNQYSTTNGLAFRWVSGEPAVVEIPRPDGGTWSSAIAISPDGNLTLAGGNSTDFPLGEVWIQAWVANAATGPIQKLGSPNTQFSPRLYGGMTEDGAVVGVTFTGAGGLGQNPTFQNQPVQYAYLHNSHGWFHLANVLADQDVDLWDRGWEPTNMILTGIRTVDTDNDGAPDVDLVFGQGRRRNAAGNSGAPEGFVASFPVGVLADYELPAPAPVANRELVGAWALGADPNSPRSVAVFMADGTFYTLSSFSVALGFAPSARFERGVYTLSAGNAFTLTTTEDRDGAGPPQSGTTPSTFVFNGLTSSLNGRLGLSVNFTSADTFVIEDASCSPLCSIVQATRIAGGPGSITGGWRVDFDQPDFNLTLVIVFLDSSAGYKYFYLADGDIEDEHQSETGTYTWDAGLHQLISTPDFGSPDPSEATLTQDQLGLTVEDDGFTFPLKRIVNPDTVLPVITNATLTGSGPQDAAFSFTITATNAVLFEAAGLPQGLTIDAATGVISGTPRDNGTFNVTITVTNTLGDTDTATLMLTFAAPPAGLYAIGDLPGGLAGSAVRDATRVNGRIFAVGSSVARDQVICTATNTPAGCTTPVGRPNLDSPAVWDSASGTLTALPPGPGVNPATQATNQIFAYAISVDGQSIASQAHFEAGGVGTIGTTAVRVDSVAGSWTNVDLASQAIAATIPNPPNVAYALADENRNIVYAQQNNTRAIRVDVTGATDVVPVPLPASTTQSFPTPRGTSRDGSVMVGVAANGAITASNGVAFRYVYAAGGGITTPIPRLDGGTWNFPVALTPEGRYTVVAGNSSANPQGEIYLYDAVTAMRTALGTPNSIMVPKLLGGITADGQAIAVTFTQTPTGILALPVGGRYAYIRNSHGWFHLSSLLAAQGIDLVAEGWDPTNMAITGVRTVEGVDLVFGQGLRRTVNATGTGYVNGALEGFVVELPAGALAAFNPTPTPPEDQSIVGTWYVGDLATTGIVLSFMADGTYVRINTNTAPTLPGFERGVYTWAGNAAGGAFMITTLNDSDGTAGGSFRNGQLGTTAIISGNTFTFADTNIPNTTFISNTRLTKSPGSLVGGWITGNPAEADNMQMAVFFGSTGGFRYYVANDGPDGDDNVEIGTYTWDPVSHVLDTSDTDPAVTTATLTRDELGIHVVISEPDTDVFTLDFTAIVDPALVQPEFTGTLSVDGTTGFAFSFTPTVNFASSFSAPELPDGLSINAATGEISGTPTAAGSFPVQLTAGNSFGDSTNAVLTITVNAPAVVVVPPGNDVPVEPDVPAGTPDITMTFDNVGVGGTEVTVAVIDPETTPELAPEPPGNFEIVTTDGGVPLFYEITASAPLTGPVTICFSYAGVDLGGQTPRLFHYVDDVWTDITTSVDSVAQTLCGETTSFSPFAIFKSTAPFKSVSGFYAPVSPIPDFVNTATAGSTVPLRFNVYVNGVEKTDVAGLTFIATGSLCSGTPEDPVDFETTGETSLRYSGGQFIQNWKTPKDPGRCYTITVALDGTALKAATFKLK